MVLLLLTRIMLRHLFVAAVLFDATPVNISIEARNIVMVDVRTLG